MNQRQDNAPEIVNYLIEHHGFKRSTDNTRLQQGKCPECGKKEAWTKVDRPHYIYCSRENKCGANVSVKDLYPHLYKSITEEFAPKLKENPNAIADAYLEHERGFRPEVTKGWYTQTLYKNPKANKHVYAVKFQVSEGCVYEAFVEPITVTQDDGSKKNQKNRIKGKYTGKVWQPPHQEILPKDHVYITEAIFKSIALEHHGLKSASALSSGNIPRDFYNTHKGKNIVWVIAMDNDNAGRKAIPKHIKYLEEIGETWQCWLPYAGQDWDDLHRAGKLNKDHYANYKYNGDLLTAESKEEKAAIIYEHQNNPWFIYDHNNRTYHAEYKQDDDKTKSIKNIAICKIEYLYYQEPYNGDEGEYFFKITNANGAPPRKIALSGKVLTSAKEFKKALVRKAPGAQFTGSDAHLDTMYRDWFFKGQKTVVQINYVGYHKEQQAYIFPNMAIQQGKTYDLNQHDFFPLKNGGIKLYTDERVEIDKGQQQYQWLNDYRQAFGTKGLVVLIWWLSTLMTQQLRHQAKVKLPFLELHDRGSTGKSEMIKFLWKLMGQTDKEGFNITTSSLAGRTRELTKVSNMPIVLMEGEEETRSHSAKFKWEELKEMYDGWLGRVVGQKDNSNTTTKNPFRAAILIEHNTPLNADSATQSRITRIYFGADHHSPKGKIALNKLIDLPMEQLSSTLLHIAKNEHQILQTVKQHYRRLETQITAMPEVTTTRIAETHAALLSMALALNKLMPLTPTDMEQIHTYINELAKQRQQSLNENHPTVELFWANFEFVDTKKNQGGEILYHQANHCSNPETEIWINLATFRNQCAQYGLELPKDADLRTHLKTSIKPKFMKVENGHSTIDSITRRFYKFKRTL